MRIANVHTTPDGDAHHDHHHDHRAETLQAGLKTAVLIGLGLYFVYNIATGNLTNYINTRFAWLSYVAAALFLVLGAANAWGLFRLIAGQHRDRDGHDHLQDPDHQHTPLSWSMLGVVALPLVLGTLVPSRPLGASAIDGQLSLTTPATTLTTTAITTRPEDRNVLDWLRVFNTVEDYGEISGQPADVIGFVYREPGFDEQVFMLARFTISCCVADASAIGVPVAWAEAPSLPDDTWVRIQGAFHVGEFRGEQAPLLQAASVEVVEQPEHPYLYP